MTSNRFLLLDALKNPVQIFNWWNSDDILVFRHKGSRLNA